MDEPVRDVDAAWSAGLFDGEGCVGVYYYGPTLGLTVQFGMTDLEPLEKLCTLWGGSIHKLGCRSTGAQVWHWTVRGKPALAMLEQMLPYLTNKREQARVALEYPPSPHGIKVSKENHAIRLRLFTQLKEMKKKPQLDQEVVCGSS